MNKTTEELATRRQALAIATAALGHTEIADTVDMFITEGLLRMSNLNPAFGMALARISGVDWPELEAVYSSDE